jgi:uncharacterized protein YjiS (DUF1127 family)
MRDYALNHARSFEAVPGGSALVRLWHNWRTRRAIARLDALDEFLLRDIGVTREEVRWAAGLPVTVNAALALDERAALRRRSGNR